MKTIAGRFESIESLRTIKIDRQKIILCHYALRVWDSCHYGSWHLYGHSHGNLPAQGLSLDVGVDSHDFTPWSWEELKGYFAQLSIRTSGEDNRPGVSKESLRSGEIGTAELAE